MIRKSFEDEVLLEGLEASKEVGGHLLSWGENIVKARVDAMLNNLGISDKFVESYRNGTSVSELARKYFIGDYKVSPNIANHCVISVLEAKLGVDKKPVDSVPDLMEVLGGIEGGYFEEELRKLREFYSDSRIVEIDGCLRKMSQRDYIAHLREREELTWKDVAEKYNVAFGDTKKHTTLAVNYHKWEKQGLLEDYGVGSEVDRESEESVTNEGFDDMVRSVFDDSAEAQEETEESVNTPTFDLDDVYGNEGVFESV